MGFKAKLNAAFREFRKCGFIARQNFQCCANCAGAALANEISDKLDAGWSKSKFKGVVFYHRQDAAGIYEGGKFCLRFGDVHTVKHGDVGMSTLEVGRIVFGILRECGVKCEWDGNPDKCITVNL